MATSGGSTLDQAPAPAQIAEGLEHSKVPQKEDLLALMTHIELDIHTRELTRDVPDGDPPVSLRRTHGGFISAP